MNKKTWLSQGKTLFGENVMNWKFKCPCCGYIATTED